MARLQLNKSSLAQQQKNLKTYQQFLPSLDLKRQQLMAEKAKAVAAISQTQTELEAHALQVSDRLPMLANKKFKLQDFVTIKHVEMGSENVVGLTLPKLIDITVATKDYPIISSPHWMDALSDELKEMLKLHITLRINKARVNLLEEAVTTVTQRLNLFDKVLIPEAKANIKKIKIYLSDEQMAAVVRSKISKKKRLLHAQ